MLDYKKITLEPLIAEQICKFIPGSSKHNILVQELENLSLNTVTIYGKRNRWDHTVLFWTHITSKLMPTNNHAPNNYEQNVNAYM